MRVYTFVTRRYKDEESARGTLARSMKDDGRNSPRTRNSHRVIRRYLEVFRDASLECLDAFDECWKEYMEHEGKGNREGAFQRSEGPRRHCIEDGLPRL